MGAALYTYFQSLLMEVTPIPSHWLSSVRRETAVESETTSQFPRSSEDVSFPHPYPHLQSPPDKMRGERERWLLAVLVQAQWEGVQGVHSSEVLRGFRCYKRGAQWDSSVLEREVGQEGGEEGSGLKQNGWSVWKAPRRAVWRWG